MKKIYEMLSKIDTVVDDIVANLKNKNTLSSIAKIGGFIAIIYLGYRLWKMANQADENGEQNEE